MMVVLLVTIIHIGDIGESGVGSSKNSPKQLPKAFLGENWLFLCKFELTVLLMPTL